MANWAQNWVEFSGEESKLNELRETFKAMALKESETNEGQLPSFLKEPKQDWFFDICVDETDTISYSTKWSPNTLDLVDVANHFNLNFISTYQESGSNIFGKAVFTAGNPEAEIFDLESSDFDKYEYLEEEDIYLYEGVKMESYDEILEDIFEKKFNQDY